MLCEYCKNPQDESFGSGRFCNETCARKFSANINKQQRLLKISNSLKTSECFRTSLMNRFRDICLYETFICPICKGIFIFRRAKSKYIKFCSRKCMDEDRRTGFKYMKKTSGAYRKGSTRSYHGTYKGIWCDSTWELAWVIYNIDHNIAFERNETGFPYMTPDGKQHLYHPDFKQGDSYTEIKNYNKDLDKYKYQSFPHQLKILYGKDLTEQFKYVYGKYGKNIKELYDKPLADPTGFEPAQ